MNETTPSSVPTPKGDYRAWLESEYSARRGRNSLYSVRSFARHLGVSKTALCEVLAGKRHLSRKNAMKVAAKLGLSPVEEQTMLRAIKRTTKTLALHPELCLRDDAFHLISDWYHYAILNLTKLANHRANPAWLAERLAIPEREAAEAVQRLVRLGFLKVEGDRLVREVGTLDTAPDVPSEAVRRAFRQSLHLAEESLDRDPVSEREFGTMTIALDAKKLQRAKEAIRLFRKRMAAELESSDPDRICTLSIQLFPVVRPEVKS